MQKLMTVLSILMATQALAQVPPAISPRSNLDNFSTGKAPLDIKKDKQRDVERKSLKDFVAAYSDEEIYYAAIQYHFGECSIVETVKPQEGFVQAILHSKKGDFKKVLSELSPAEFSQDARKSENSEKWAEFYNRVISKGLRDMIDVGGC